MIVPVVLAVAFVATASTVFAQPQKEPLPVAVLDLRAASVGLPTTGGWTPPVPDGTLVPSRNFGFDIGGHVYLLRGRRFALGVGAGLVLASGTETPPEVEAGQTPSTNPDVTTRLKSLTPQVSINFGHRFGWSYLSGGIGPARITSEASAPLTASSPSSVDTDWFQAINYGGGARWFINDHVALSLDLRFHKLPALAATTTRFGTQKETLIVAGGGISLK